MKNQLTGVQNIKINNRSISFRRIGNGKRKILFYHGFPGSSAQIEPFRDYLQDFDIEVLCFDRPGYHTSDSTNESQMAQTTEVSRQIMNAFNWSTCELISVSGGTPFLFSFLNKYPELISRVAVVCGLGPMMSPGFQDVIAWKAKIALKILPFIPDFIFAKIFPKDEMKNSSSRFEIISFFLRPSAADIKTIQNPINQSILRQAVTEAIHQNGKGPKLDAESFLTPWKINVADYKGPIHFWHGDDDLVIPVKMAQRMHQQVERSELNILSGEGHYSIAFNHLELILSKGIS